jgi:nucleoside-diphosphate-sugar epimerase
MILVTGGTGLVGSHLIKLLLTKGYDVRALVRPGRMVPDDAEVSRLLTGNTNKPAGNFEWFEADILDPFALSDALQDVSHVYHCAAVVSFSKKDSHSMLAVNVEGTSNIVNACLNAGVEKLCYVSSIAALGQAEPGQMTDENTKWKTSRNNSAYAVSKYGGEREVWRGAEEGLKVVILSPSVIIGSGLLPGTPDRMFGKLNRMMQFYTSGVNGYVDVRDVANAMLLLIQSDVSGERFVINSENISYHRFMQLTAQLTNRKGPRFKISKPLLRVIAAAEELRGFVTGSKPLITGATVRAATGKSYYSAEKFSNRFNYKFIPVHQSLADTLKQIST